MNTVPAITTNNGFWVLYKETKKVSISTSNSRAYNLKSFLPMFEKKCPTVHFRQRGGGAFKKVAPLYQNKFAWRNLKKKAKIGSGLLGRRCQDSKVHDFFCSSGGNNYPLLKYWSGGNIGHIFLSGGRSIGKQEGGYLNPWPGWIFFTAGGVLSCPLQYSLLVQYNPHILALVFCNFPLTCLTLS